MAFCKTVSSCRTYTELRMCNLDAPNCQENVYPHQQLYMITTLYSVDHDLHLHQLSYEIIVRWGFHTILSQYDANIIMQ